MSPRPVQPPYFTLGPSGLLRQLYMYILIHVCKHYGACTCTSLKFRLKRTKRTSTTSIKTEKVHMLRNCTRRTLDYKAEIAKFKEQLQRVGADNGRLSKSMREKEAQMQAERVALQRQLEEKYQYAEALKADKNTLQ